MSTYLEVYRKGSSSLLLSASWDMWLEKNNSGDKYAYTLRVGDITITRHDGASSLVELNMNIGGTTFYKYDSGTPLSVTGKSINCTASSSGEVWVPITITDFQCYSGKYSRWIGRADGSEPNGDSFNDYTGEGYYASGLIKYNVYCYNTDGSLVASYLDKSYNSSITLPSTATNTMPKTRSSEFKIIGNINGGNGSNLEITAKNNYSISYSIDKWVYGSTKVSPGGSWTVTSDASFTVTWKSSETLSSSENNKISNLEAAGTPTKSSDGGMYDISLYLDSSGTLFDKVTFGETNSYTFGGWANSPDSTTKLPSTTAYTSAVIVYAIWNKSTVSITEVNLPTPKKDMVVVDSYTITQVVDEYTSVAHPSLTANRGKAYIFKGWAKNGTLVTTPDNTYYVPGNDSTPLYAQWTEELATEQIKLDIPTRTDFIFIGWEATKGSKNYVTDYTMLLTPTKSMSVYAVFKPRFIAEIFIYHNGKWCLANPHIRYMDIFNESVNAI